MTRLQEVPLDRKGAEYVDWVLEAANGGLAHRLRDIVSSSGKIFAPVPQDTKAERVVMFNAGWLMEHGEGLAWLAERVLSRYAEGANGSFIVQDLWGEPKYAKEEQPKLGKFFNGESVHFFLTGPEIRTEAIVPTFFAPISFRAIAAFVRPPIDVTRIPTSEYVPDRFLDELAQNAQELYVGAYDQEGFVVWRRS